MPRRNSSLLLWTKALMASGVIPVGFAAMVVVHGEVLVELVVELEQENGCGEWSFCGAPDPTCHRW